MAHLLRSGFGQGQAQHQCVLAPAMAQRIVGPAAPDGGNRWRYASPAVDDLLLQGRRELDPQKRIGIYAQAQRLIADDVPLVPLWHEDNIVIANTAVTGYRIVPNARLAGLISATKTPKATQQRTKPK